MKPGEERSMSSQVRSQSRGVGSGEEAETWGRGQESRGAEPGDEAIYGVESEVGSLEGRQLCGGANVRGRGFRRRSGLEEMRPGGAR